MEIQDYIKASKIAGYTTAQIELSLLKVGWTKEQIEPYLDLNTDTKVINPHRIYWGQYGWKLVKIGILMITIISLPIIKQIYTDNTVISDKYGFKFTSLQGWRKVKPRYNSYISLEVIPKEVIPNNKFKFSVAGMEIITEVNGKFLGKVNANEIRVYFSAQCRAFADKQGLQYAGTETLQIPKTNSYKCTLKEKTKSKFGTLSIFEHYFIVKKKYNILLFANYFNDYPEGKIYIKKLMDDFQVVN